MWLLNELANALYEAGRHDEALVVVDRAVAAAPTNAYALGTRGQILGALDRAAEAAEAFHAARTPPATPEDQPPDAWILSEADRVLAAAGGRDGHIFNLGHGVLPDTPSDSLARLVEHVHLATERTAVANP